MSTVTAIPYVATLSLPQEWFDNTMLRITFNQCSGRNYMNNYDSLSNIICPKNKEYAVDLQHA